MKVKDWVIIGLTLVIISLIIFDKDTPESDKQAYIDSLRFLKAKERDIIAQEVRIIQASKDKAKNDSAKLALKDKEIQALKGRSVKTRVIIQHIIDTIPDLRVFVAQQDSIIQIQGITIDTLKASVEFQRKLFDDLVISHNTERDISKRIEDEQEEYIQKLEKQVKKAKRANRWLKATAVVGSVGAFLLGSQL